MTDPTAAELVAEIRERWKDTTQGPWFWWGNTDYQGEALCGRQPGLGVCEVISTLKVERTAADLGARQYREFLTDHNHYEDTPEGQAQLDEEIRDGYLTDKWGEPETDTVLAVTTPDHIRASVREQAVYSVARAQGLPDDTPRTHPKVYRANICDTQTPNGKALAAAWSDVHRLCDALERLAQ